VSLDTPETHGANARQRRVLVSGFGVDFMGQVHQKGGDDESLRK
jgi:hypothetical protein